MVEIDVRVSLNETEEAERLGEIKKEYIKDFLGEGFISNCYEAKFIYECAPRAISPEAII